MNRRLTWTAAALAVGAFAFGGLVCGRGSSPENVRDGFHSALERRDWEGLFALMSEEERAKGSWTKGSFMGLLDAVAPSNGASEYRLIELPARSPGTRAYRVEAVVQTAPGERQEASPTWMLEVMRGKGGWRAKLDTLPLFLNRLGGGSPSQRKVRLAEAMERVGKPFLADFRSGAVLTVEGLRISAWSESDEPVWTHQ